MLPFRHTKQTSKNVVDRTFNWNEELTLSEENPNLSLKAFLNIVDRLQLTNIDLKNPSSKQNVKHG